MDDTIRRAELIATLRARLAQSADIMLEHLPHGCPVAVAAHGAMQACAEMLADIGAGPALTPTVSVGEVMRAHGIPGPWDREAPAARPAVDVTATVATFASELDTVAGIGPDGNPFYGPSLS